MRNYAVPTKKILKKFKNQQFAEYKSFKLYFLFIQH